MTRFWCVLCLALMAQGCSTRAALVDLYASLHWRQLPSANSLLLSAGHESAVLDSIGFVQGPHAQGQIWTPVGEPLDFVVPLRAATATGVMGCAEWRSALQTALTRLTPVAARWFVGSPLPAIEVRIAAPLQGVRYWESSAGRTFTDTTMYLAMPPPDPSRCGHDLVHWAADVIETVMHELQHVRAFQRVPAPASRLEDEFNASLLGHCARYLVLGLLPYDFIVTDGAVAVSEADALARYEAGDLDASMAGKLMADAYRRRMLGPGAVTGPLGERFIGLCDRQAKDHRLPHRTGGHPAGPRSQ